MVSRSPLRRVRLVVAIALGLASACASQNDDTPLSIRLRDSAVEGGDPVFVTLELREPQDAQALSIQPGLRLRRDGRDVNLLIARTPQLESYPPISAPGTSVPAVSLAAGTEYRFDVPDVEPGFHELCVSYMIRGVAAQSCTELSLT